MKLGPVLAKISEEYPKIVVVNKDDPAIRYMMLKVHVDSNDRPEISQIVHWIYAYVTCVNPAAKSMVYHRLYEHLGIQDWLKD